MRSTPGGLVLTAALALASLACAEPQVVPFDPMAGHPPSDRKWYGEWQRARGLTTTVALHDRVRLALAWASDREMATRLSRLAGRADIEGSFQQAVEVLLKAAPDDPGLWYARGWWKLVYRGEGREAAEDGCRAAGLAPIRSAYHELCGDATISVGEVPAGVEHLVKAYGLASARPDQCRLIEKIQRLAPDPDRSLSAVSPQVMAYCQRAHDDLMARQQLDAQRQMHLNHCGATCQAALQSCQDLSRLRPGGNDCAVMYDNCVAECGSNVGSRPP